MGITQKGHPGRISDIFFFLIYGLLNKVKEKINAKNFFFCQTILICAIAKLMMAFLGEKKKKLAHFEIVSIF